MILPVHDSFLHVEDAVQPQGKAKRRTLAEIKVLILDTLENSGNLPATELAAAMGYAKVSGTITKAIKELIAEGKVVYSEPERIHSRNQKICLVENKNE